MKFSPLARSISLGTLAVALSVPLAAQAAFIEDSKASIELRNFYMNRDFRSSNTSPGVKAPALKYGRQSKAEEWAQGFLLRYESGFTEGTVGVGVDAYGFTGFKLDSGGGTAGTGLLPRSKSSGKAPSSYGELGGTFKARLSESTLKAGTVIPKIPTVSSGDGRLIPQTFTGVTVNSKDVENLTVDLGRLGRMNQRNSTDNAPIILNGFSGSQAKRIDRNTNKGRVINDKNHVRVNDGKTSKFDFAGLNYVWGDTGLSTGYNYAQFHDEYKQHILNGIYTLQLDDNQSLKTDLRFARTSEDGKSGIDNKAISGMLTYKLGYNSFGLGYQKMSGDTGFAYIELTDPFLTNYVQIRDFAATDEKSWQARYDYNFAGLGIPGLNLMTRYIKGSNIYMGSGKSRGNEWERDTDIAYTFQEGPLKNLGVKWRNATLRSDISGKIDENRLIVSYTIPLL